LIGKYLAPGSVVRRVSTRAVIVLGAALVGGQVMGKLPHDQTLVFPVGSVFPDATHFEASWRRNGDREPLGGVTRSFGAAPPLQIREHARLPDGDYIVTIGILEKAEHSRRETDVQSSGSGGGLQTNFDRRVNLTGGEAMILLTRPAKSSDSE